MRQKARKLKEKPIPTFFRRVPCLLRHEHPTKLDYILQRHIRRARHVQPCSAITAPSIVKHATRRHAKPTATHRIYSIPSVFACMSNTLSGSCPSGNKLAKIKSRSSLGANVLSCWLRCDGERAVVIVVMTLTRETLLLGEMLAVGGGVGTCVCVWIWIWYCG